MKVLILSANPQSFANVKAVGISLVYQGIDVSYLDTQSLYHQRFEVPSKFTRIITGISSSKPFYISNILRKIRILEALRKVVKSNSKKFDIILTGDLGMVECTIIKTLKVTKVFFIQDALLLRKQKMNLTRRLRYLYYGFRNRFSFCSYIFCSGQTTKESLILSGARPEQVYATGIPRFDNSHFESKPYDNKKLTVVVIGEAFAWHNLNSMQEAQKEFFEYLNDFSISNPAVEILIRKHPRDFYKYPELESLNFINGLEEGLGESISRANMVIGYAVPSTVLFEIMRDNIPILFVKHEKIEYSTMICKNEFFNHVQSVEDFKQLDVQTLKNTINADLDFTSVGTFINHQSSLPVILDYIMNEMNNA
ncbi:hypothetical protein [Marinoscillum sp.]|uniref:hypothetical protein n=1 Tax=Marinoscillum sp. TaxID=2024838 RepID=UPI003BA858E9